MSKANQGGPAGQGSDTEVVRALRAARAKLNRGWCQFSFANGRSGRPVDPTGTAAVEFCAIGALRAAVGQLGDISPARDAVAAVIGGPVSVWNDAPRRTQAQVLRVFDKAIRVAQKQRR